MSAHVKKLFSSIIKVDAQSSEPYFSAPFRLEQKEMFLNIEDEAKFFTNAQRAFLVDKLLLVCTRLSYNN
jgi:hypothetical protein